MTGSEPRPRRVALPSLLGAIAFAVGCDAVIGENFDGYRPMPCATAKQCGTGGRVNPRDSGSGGAGAAVVNLMTVGSSALPPGIAGSRGALDAAVSDAGARSDAAVDASTPRTPEGGSTSRDSSPECGTGDAPDCGSVIVCGDGVAEPCVCPAGFKRLEPPEADAADQLGRCVPEDDCALTNACDERAICKSEAFTYSCRCPAYYRDDAHGRRCEDHHYQWHMTMGPGVANLQLNPFGSHLLVAGAFRGENSVQGLKVDTGGDFDVFVAELDEQGTLVQYRQLGGTLHDGMHWSATDSRGDLLITGYTDGGLDLGSGPIDTGGRRARYVAKLRATDLAPVWGRVFYNVDVVPDDPPLMDQIWDGHVSTDASGNVLFAGRFHDELTADSFTLKSAGGWDMFLAKLSPAGDLLWVKSWGGPGNDFLRAAVADAQGNIFASGTFEQRMTIGDTTFTSLFERDTVFAKLSPEGSPLWSRHLGGYGYDYCGRMSIDHNGNPIVVGDFTGQEGFGSGSIDYSHGGFDAFITKWDTNGDFMWSRQIGGGGDDVLWDVAVGPANETFVVGNYDRPVDFGEAVRSTNGSVDGFVAKYSADNEFISSQNFGGSGFDQAYVVRIASTGTVYVGGGFQDGADFGGGPVNGAGIYWVSLAP